MSARQGVPWAEARALAFGAPTELTPVQVGLAEAIGRVVRADVVARQDIPHYASSAMDGWAVSGPGPWRLVPAGPLVPGTACVVATGAVLPEGILGVLRLEHGAVSAGMLTRTPEAKEGEPGPGSHVRPPATEARRGEVLIAAGTLLNPAHAAVAAAAGHDELLVAARPDVRLLLTGDEVVEAGIPAAGQVRDSHGPQLPALLTLLGAGHVTSARVQDDLDATVVALGDPTQGEDLVVVTGGTGVSDADYVRAALGRLGAEVVVDGLRCRPGGPTTLARLPDGRWVLALAGNPLAAVVGLMGLGAPLIAGLSGLPTTAAVPVGAHDLPAAHPAVTMVTPALLRAGRAAVTGWRGSGMMRGLAAANALLVVHAGNDGSGNAEALPLPWSGGLT